MTEKQQPSQDLLTPTKILVTIALILWKLCVTLFTQGTPSASKENKQTKNKTKQNRFLLSPQVLETILGLTQVACCGMTTIWSWCPHPLVHCTPRGFSLWFVSTDSLEIIRLKSS